MRHWNKFGKIMKIDINCDMGESFGPWKMGEDREVVPHVSSVNIACGFHAGDPGVMAGTVALAVEHGVGIGAHPGYPDLSGFGRRTMETRPEEVKNGVLYQLGALGAFTRVSGVRLRHVKPHGALYNTVAGDERIALEVIRAVKAYGGDLILVALAGSPCLRLAREEGLRTAAEAFPDRAYTRNGRLAPRSRPGAVLHDTDTVVERTVRLVTTGRMISIDGEEIEVRADTLCIHGDTPGAWRLAAAVRMALESTGVRIAPMGEP